MKKTLKKKSELQLKLQLKLQLYHNTPEKRDNCIKKDDVQVIT